PPRVPHVRCLAGELRARPRDRLRAPRERAVGVPGHDGSRPPRRVPPPRLLREEGGATVGRGRSGGHMNDLEIEQAAEALEAASPGEILAWAAARFAPLGFATALDPEGGVLLAEIARLSLQVDAFTLDTGLLFPETYTLWHDLELRY